VPLRFVEANHPAVESFHATNSFEMITKAQQELNQGVIDWIHGAKKLSAEGKPPASEAAGLAESEETELVSSPKGKRKASGKDVPAGKKVKE